MKRFVPCKKLLIDETNELLSNLIDKNYEIKITEDDMYYYVCVSLSVYWQKAMPKLMKWDSIRQDIFNYLHHICTEFHVNRDVVVIKRNDEEFISLKRLETLSDCQIKSLKFKIDKEVQ